MINDARKGLTEIETCDLVEELKQREAIEFEVIPPYENKSIKVNGPKIVIIVED
jgi:hypothetical protein